ncbi:hypothetical protein ECG_03636 [Echinococcus granulosus]|uniref:Expressed conserved protein n=1 Tax=Echinococcus granulosus TaxID=6210 RepID=U6JQN8_ECHGR|nr:hypothetical protein EGR_09345 [Echinococcus granulosus]EUB55779.1 hypothetical protein EGR_09345 [Echinococcus granulosus]KAH9282497.1 hypothetical protein ECG_03636 [Echinococcus granulosus]CDS24213.1 expressed conserved protein [Echinococcus granulosus]
MSVCIRVLHAIYALFCITCTTAIYNLRQFKYLNVYRAVFSLIASAVAIVFGVIITKRYLYWILIPIFVDAGLILFNMATMKPTRPLDQDDWVSVALVIGGLLHYCLGLVELIYTSMEQRNDEEDSECSDASVVSVLP